MSNLFSGLCGLIIAGFAAVAQAAPIYFTDQALY